MSICLGIKIPDCPLIKVRDSILGGGGGGDPLGSFGGDSIAAHWLLLLHCKKHLAIMAV